MRRRNNIINCQMVQKSNDPDFKRQEKEFDKFKTNLGTVLGSFERAREWADLSNCLQRIKKTFAEHLDLPVPLKKDLAKRLAQCLNPDLNVIHSLTLEVYNLVFERELSLAQAGDSDGNPKIRFGADLALFYSGLFSFYQFAAFEVKKYFMEMIKDKILKFDRELVLCLPGFLVCMLPALEEQNTEQLKKIEDILLETEKIVGTSKFFGEIWKTIIRSPRCRLSAIKYLDRRIPKDVETATRLANEGKCCFVARYSMVVKNGKAFLQEQLNGNVYSDWATEESEMKQNLRTHVAKAQFSYFYFFYPNKQQLVVQALLAGLQIGDKNENYVNRATLDFMISHLPINGNFLDEEERVNLVEGCLCTLPKKDFASLKKFFVWFQGHLSEDDQKPQKDDPAIKAVIEALKRILQQFLDLKENKQEDVLNEMGIHTQQSKTSFLTPITIIRSLFSDNFIAEPILEEISVDLIKYIKHYYATLSAGKLLDFQQKVNNLFEMLNQYLNCVWRSLGSQLSGEIRNVSQKISSEGQQIEAVDLITFFLKELNVQEKPVTIENIGVVQGLAKSISIAQEDFKEKQLLQMQKHETFLEMIKPIFSNLLSGVDKISNQMQNLEQALPALDLIANILEIMNQYVPYASEKLISNLQHAVDSFNKFYISMVDFNDKGLSKEQQMDYAKKNQLYTTLKKSSSILYEVQRYADPNSFNQIPKWLEKVIECSCTKSRGTNILLISIGVFLRIIQTTETRGNMHKMYELVKPQRSIDSSQKNHCTEIIKTLWSLLDDSCDHVHVVQLLKQFDIRLPRIFSDVVTAELNSKERGVKYRAVNKFSIFWKLTAKDYPDYKPFQPIALRSKDQVLDEDNTQLNVSDNKDNDNDRRYIALQNMLQILDDDDPTLRLACRSWLTESQSDFQRILDPILNEFLDNNRVFKSFTGQIFFLENYEPKVVINNFGKLRNIILNTQSEFIEYIVNNQISEYISVPFKKQFSHIEHKQDTQNENSKLFCDDKYIQAIVYITLQFIVGQAVESLNSGLFIETQTVNASACEFMEQVMKSIYSKTTLSIEITHLIVRPLVNALRQAINNKNNAQQVHLLNLLQVIIIDGNFYIPQFDTKRVKQESNRITEVIENAKQLFMDNQLSQCIVDGMKSSQAIVRYHYITFSDKIIKFMQKCLSNTKDQVKFVQNIIDCYCWLLQKADVTQYSTSFERDPRHYDNKSEMITRQNTENSKKPQSKSVGFTAQVHINQENDIAQIFDGLKKILINCLEIEVETKIEDLAGDTQAQGMQPAKKGMFFNLFAKSKKESTVDNFVSQAVFNTMEDVMLAVINCWNSTSLYTTKDNFFTRLGVMPYNREDDRAMSKQIKQRIKEILKEDKGSKRDNKAKNKDATIDQLEEGTNEDENKISHKNYLKPHFNLIQQHIVDFLHPFTEKYLNNILHKTLNIWGMSATFDRIGMSVNEGCEKIIQIFLSLSIPPYKVIESVQEYIRQHDWNCVKQKKDMSLEVQEKESATTQSLYCHFVYQYLQSSISNHFQQNIYEEDGNTMVNNVEKQYILLYENMLKFFKCFIYSRSPITVCWLLEILNVLSTKFKPEDSKLDKKVKQDYLEILDTLLKSATMIIQDTFGVIYHEQFGIKNISFSPTVYEMIKRYEFVKSKNPGIIEDEALNYKIEKSQEKSEVLNGFNLGNREYQDKNLAFNERQLSKYDEIPLQKDSMFETLAIVRDPKQFFRCAYLSEFMANLNNHLHDDPKPLSDERQRAIFKVFTIVTLRQILVPLVESIHSPDNKDQQYISMTIVLNGVTKVIDQHIKQLSEKITPNKNTVCEFLTEFLAYIAGQGDILQKNYKQEITNMFNEEAFFFLHERMLRQWQYVMSHMLKRGSDEVFEEQLLKFNKMEGFFTSKSDVYQKQSLTFKRLAFLVFSNKSDDFKEDQLDGLLKKMTEGFKNQEKNEDMKQQLFLLSRILMLRLKAGQLEDALRKLWPHLLNELVNVFDQKNNEKFTKQDWNLTREAILIIELMSALNIEDFQIDQWMFLFDGYGIAYEPVQVDAPDNDDGVRFGVVDGKFALRSKEPFQPYMIQFMCKKPTKVNPVGESEDFSKQEMRVYKIDSIQSVQNPSIEPRMTAAVEFERDQTLQPGQIASMEGINGPNSEYIEESIQKYVRIMQNKLAESNVKRTEIDRTSAENLLEKEFIVKADKK